jgi:hypothetical protein
MGIWTQKAIQKKSLSKTKDSRFTIEAEYMGVRTDSLYLPPI